MSASLRFSLSAAAVAALAAVCALSAEHANAQTTLTFPTGQVCKNSAVTVTIGNNAREVTRTFTSPSGTVTRTLIAGTGPDPTFFNPNHPNVTFSLPGNGGVEWTAARPDGTSTITTTGHNVIFYFPTDTLLGNKPGPATLLVVGREVINVDAAGNFTQVSQTGDVTDICAKLPPD
jgi:hypothetical protein